MLTPPHPLRYEELLRTALAEDLGIAGDLTTDAIVPPTATAEGVIAARAAGRVAGLEVAAATFRMLDPGVVVSRQVAEGEKVVPGVTLATVAGPARALLTGERTALNLLGRLSGIATATSELVAAVAAWPCRVVPTRKTTPGLRALERYAVRTGGGADHRFGLDDAVLIKDNHIAIAGSIGAAVERVRAHVGHLVKIEVEVDTLEQLNQAVALKIDAVLLDNMTPEQLAEAVQHVPDTITSEASGGITLATAPAVAAAGVNLLSVGWLTHSAAALDLALDLAT